MVSMIVWCTLISSECLELPLLQAIRIIFQRTSQIDFSYKNLELYNKEKTNNYLIYLNTKNNKYIRNAHLYSIHISVTLHAIHVVYLANAQFQMFTYAK